MKETKIKSLCILILLSFCLLLSSCKNTGNILQSSAEVDFTTPQKVQIAFNERIYDTAIVRNGPEIEIKFINEKDLLKGACAWMSSERYKISYNEMVFEGDAEALSASSLPAILYDFLSSFENVVVLDSFNTEKNCHYIKRNINGCFVVLEVYEKENESPIFSIEIK